MSVSIPERVWGGLERAAFGYYPKMYWNVSIPERVWGGLERRASESLTVFGFRGTNARTLQV
jgi:hypothetical protein